MHRALLLVVVALVAACGPGDPEPVTWTGAVTTLAPVLCVGRDGANGDCFTGGPAAGLRVGECVSVTFTPHAPGVEGPEALTDLHRTSALGHEQDCPSS